MKTINETELATNLAHNATRDEMINKDIINDESEMWVKSEDDEEVDVYTDEAQEIFNRHFDYFIFEIGACLFYKVTKL